MVNWIDGILYCHLEPDIFGRAPTSVFSQEFPDNHILAVGHQSSRPRARLPSCPGTDAHHERWDSYRRCFPLRHPKH